MPHFTRSRRPWRPYIWQITEYGLQAPTTHDACESLLVFIDNSTHGNKEYRIKLLQDAQEEWTGKSVRLSINNLEFDPETHQGTVRFVTAMRFRDIPKGVINPLAHLRALVRTPCGRSRYFRLDSVQHAD